MLVNYKLNGLDVSFDVEPHEYLLDVLRNHGVKSLKKGCDSSSCGVCTILVNEKPVLSCSLLAIKADGCEITTVEGIQEEASKIADCFVLEGASQCGYCNASLTLVIHALVREIKNPSYEEIKRYLVGNLCRCTGYSVQLKAIKRYIEGLNNEKI